MCVFRNNGKKFEVEWHKLTEKIPLFIEDIQKGMYIKATANFEEKIKRADKW